MKTILELIDDQIETTMNEQDALVADPSYTVDERKSQVDWNDGWASALAYIKRLVQTEGMELK